MKESHIPDELSVNQEAEIDLVPASTKPLKEFSKESAQTERDSLAHEIKTARKERHSKLMNAKNESIRSQEILEQVSTDLKNLSQEIETISVSGFSRLVNFITLRRLKNQLQEADDLKIKSESKKAASEYTASNFSISEQNLPAEFQESKRKIDRFYQRQMEVWKNLPYEQSDVEKFFNKEYLASLSLKDYEILLARFSSNMVTHVTRQGIRDHFGMMEHSVGLGKVSNGFRDLINDGKLKHGIELKITEDDKEAAIAKYLDLENIPTREKALSKLEDFTGMETQHFAGSFVDFHSVHFAVKSVADAYYGSESGNEIFLAYPSYVMASNYFHRRDPHVAIGGSNYNDVWVYVEEDSEVPVDAGVVFIPKNARVSPTTGSKYEINADEEAVPDNKKIARMMEIIKLDGFKDFCGDACKKLGKMSNGFDKYLLSNSDEHKEEFETIENLLSELKRICPEITEEEIRVVMDYNFLWKLNILNPEEIEKNSISIIEGRLVDLGIYYKKSLNTVSSQEYWENYFAENPSQKPSKIVYYEEEDPTSALSNWQRETDQSYGKDHKPIKEKQLNIGGSGAVLPEEIVSEMKRFTSIAENVIHNFYDSREL